jgi:hypothetical protein
LAGPDGRTLGEARQNRNTAFDPASQRLRASKADFFQLGVRRGFPAGDFPLRRRRSFLIRTDIPHWDSEFPENLQKIQKRQDLTDETKNKLLYKNAEALYAI